MDTVIHEVRDGRKRRFTAIDNEILDYADLTASELCVYLALCRFASYDTGQCFPGVETLAKKARCSERTVKDCVKALEAKGYVSVQRGAMGKTKRRNVYTILDVEDTPAWEAAQADRKAKREMVQHLPHSGAEMVQNLPHSMVQDLPHSGPEMVQHLPMNSTSTRPYNRTSKEQDPGERIGTGLACAATATPTDNDLDLHGDPMGGRVESKKVIGLYHQLCPSLPKVQAWNDKRQGLLRARCKESQERMAPEWWDRFFRRVEDSDFLTGRTGGSGDRAPFLADLEWLLRPTNFVKVLEGRYDNRGTGCRVKKRLEDMNERERREIRVDEYVRQMVGGDFGAAEDVGSLRDEPGFIDI